MKILINFLLLTIVTMGQSPDQAQPIPPSPVGVTLGKPDAPFTLTAYYDLTCIDSKYSHEQLNQVWPQFNNWNQNQVQYTQIIFPLPYHYNGFTLAQGFTYFQENYPKDAANSFINFSFNNFEYFTNDATKNMTNNQVAQELSLRAYLDPNLAQFGISQNQLYNALQNSTINYNTRIMWKLVASLEVYGAPFFFANGVYLPEASGWNTEKWVSFLKPYYE